MENDFLQSIKLEISRNVTLSAYERISFHKILSIEKSNNGAQILIRDLQKPDAIRKSALLALQEFSGSDVTDVFTDICKNTKNGFELKVAFEYFEKNPTPEALPVFITYYNTYNQDNTYGEYIQKVIYLIGLHAEKSQEALELLISIAGSTDSSVKQREMAIEMLVSHTDLSLYERILEERVDQLTRAVFNALAQISKTEMDKYRPDETDIYTKFPAANDNFLLNIRVLLSKMTSRFDGFAFETKISFIKALLACNHREYIVYIMKALTSDDINLIDSTLFTILSNIAFLQNPDKLFRSLISMPSLTCRDDRIIEDIFISYFSSLPENRNSNLIRDKIYNYIIVMLDNFFENYRKNYMIPDIVEKDYIQEIQVVRNFVLEQLNPRLKRRLMKYLTTQDLELKNLIIEMSETISYISEKEEKNLHLFLETLFEEDSKAQEITASQINDIDFEKKYLKHRIIRLCTIIGSLKIQEASDTLVKILNYVKKYYEEDLYYSTALALSRLNYPYMLKELELVLEGEENYEIKKKTIELLSQYNEHRALTILLEYLKLNHREKDPLLQNIFSIILKQDLNKDKVANDTAKMIIERNLDPDIAAGAVLMLGKTAFEKDVLYLHELIMEAEHNNMKEAAVQSMQMIVDNNSSYKKKNIIPLYKGYLKDPAIRVRIYSCIFLIQLGDTGALSLLKDMMVIKNKDIQRDILLLLGNFITAELAFFLLSLVKEEYAISNDIIPLFYFLSPDDRQQIDYFITNLFKRHEGTRLEYNKKHVLEENEKYITQMNSFKTSEKMILRISILNLVKILEEYNAAELSIIKKDTVNMIIRVINENGGTLSRIITGQIVAYFDTSPDCAKTALDLLHMMNDYNRFNSLSMKNDTTIYIEKSSITTANEEILFYNFYDYNRLQKADLSNRIFLRKDTADSINLLFKSEQLPETIFPLSGTSVTYNELLSPLNFQALTDSIITSLKQERKEKLEEQRELEKTVLKSSNYSSSKATELSQSLHDIGRMLKKEMNEISKYTKKRSTDRELIKQVDKMTADIYKRYNIEISKLKLE